MSHAFKKIQKDDTPHGYHPAHAVKEYGDHWIAHSSVSGADWLTLRSAAGMTQDYKEFTIMSLMELGALRRVEE